MTPMQLGIEKETQVFLLACLSGVGLGAVYDCLRSFRAMIPHNKIAEFAEDFFYSVFFGLVYFIFAVAQTGQLRFFTFVGMAVGAVMERAALGDPVVTVVRAVSSFVCKYIVSPAAEFIAKIARSAKSVFVKNHPKFSKSKKDVKKVLKV